MAVYATAGNRRSVLPSAPPQTVIAMGDNGPPGYDAVLANDSMARQTAAEFRNRNLMGSLAYAGGWSHYLQTFRLEYGYSGHCQL